MCNDALAHGTDDAGQFIATDMGMCLVEDIIFGSKLMEEFHHTLHITAFLTARVELAVGESTCAAFAKAVVGLGVEPLVAVEYRNIFFALGYIFSSLVDDRFNAMLNESQGRK